MFTSVITVGSQTNTIKGQRLLKQSGIGTELVKVNVTKGRGCIYGLRLNSDSVNAARAILNNNGIKILEEE